MTLGRALRVGAGLLLLSACQSPRGSGELRIEDAVVGQGAAATSGRRVRIHYDARLPDGRVVESGPVEFVVGQGLVMSAWERGVDGMRVGGRRRLVVPPQLAYGAHGHPPAVPPNATLIFEIQLLRLD